MTRISVRELKLTACLYALKSGVLDHVKRTGTLPENIPTGGSQIAMRLLIEQRGTDPTLSEDEELVYEALLQAIRERRRLPGGAVVLVDEESKRQSGSEKEGES